MDDSNPVASNLQMFFGDEDEDAVAVQELSLQLGRHPDSARDLCEAWDEVLRRRDADAARSLVEDFANRDVQGSGHRALDWLATIYEQLEPLWRSVGRQS